MVNRLLKLMYVFCCGLIDVVLYLYLDRVVIFKILMLILVV